ncbi:hypothetical protein FACS1894158_00080 [Betaproteobacteria bacterium]|nr:hypothetical protein FACS1894158_00080 [Betaproteobacteria bacterium]
MSLVNCALCPHVFHSPGQRGLKQAECAFPVDAVYTWVDGSDPAHAAKRARYLTGNVGSESKHSNVSPLFRDNEELRYSLRSLTAYAPWIRRIFIITDAQKPKWLRADNPRLSFVDHTQIIPPHCLPTFNSHVIESYLHRIPDLAEHYIYFNDDCFLTAKAVPGDFFTSNGLPFLFMDWRASRREGYENTHTPHARSWFNTRAELARRGVAPAPEIITAHIPFAQTKSNAEAVFSFFADAIADFSHNKFRTTEEMAFYCHAASLWCFAMKKAVPCDVAYWYVNTKRRNRRSVYAALLAQKNSAFAPLFLCLNDVSPGTWAFFWRRSLIKFLQQYFPLPSPFE